MGPSLSVDSLDCQTTSDNPAYFTACDDDTVGEILPDSVHVPAGYYGGDPLASEFSEGALQINQQGDTLLQHARFAYQGTAIGYNNQNSNTITEIYLGMGDNGGGSGAMGWSLNVNLKTIYPGSLYFEQLINRNFSWDIRPHGIHLPRSDSTDGEFWLDNESPYSAATIWPNTSEHPLWTKWPMIYGDAPHLEDAFYSFADLTDIFKTYVKFQPEGGIPVTLGRVDWNWHGSTAVSDGVWRLADDTVGGPVLQVEDDSFPFWTSVYHNSNN